MKDSKRSRPVSGVSRRRFIKGTAVGVAVAGFPAIVRSANDRKIVIRDPGGPFTPGFAAAYRNGPRELDSAVSEIFLGFQAAKSR